MVEFPLQKLIKLVDYDQQINIFEKEVDTKQYEIRSLQAEAKALIDQFETIVQQRREARKNVDTKELQMKELDQQEKEKKKKLDHVTNQKEYQSIMHEIEKLKKAQHDFEQDLLLAWQELENIDKLYQEKEQKHESDIVALEKAVTEKKEAIDKLKNNIQTFEEKRPDLLKGIPEELLEKYATMRKQISNPVVPIADSSCTACFYSLPRQVILNIQRGKIVQCLGCFRFLYDASKVNKGD